jgi:hypothetical protein
MPQLTNTRFQNLVLRMLKAILYIVIFGGSREENAKKLTGLITEVDKEIDTTAND